MEWHRLLLFVNAGDICAAQNGRSIGSDEDRPQRPAQTVTQEARNDIGGKPFAFSGHSERLTLEDLAPAIVSVRRVYTRVPKNKCLPVAIYAGELYGNLAPLDDKQSKYRQRGVFFIDPSNRTVPSPTLKSVARHPAYR
jgi:hypothetical protein